ncbi:MAG TPA: esterase-like activity of phytase family protein [Xanthobacteraceae bacterium]|nr:esterase-like activity of phytase family protein [Xanthobacteraceae bacterium]
MALVVAPVAAQGPQPAGAQRIEVRAERIDTFALQDGSRTRFGALEFRGGLILTSSYRRFGGLSAIRVAPDGARFLALSDRGQWFRGRIVYRGGRPVGLAEVETAPVLGPDGRPVTTRRWFDTESLAEMNGTLYVGIERANQILRFDYARDGLAARGVPIAVPPGVRTLVHNGGLECLAAPARGQPLAGALIAISEKSLDEQGNMRAFLIGGPRPGNFAVLRSADFDVTDCAVTPRGDLLILERKFSLALGVAMRIRRVPLTQIGPGALVDGPVLIEANGAYQIDNMEGLSVHRDAAGEIILTLVSDDNFSTLQRTLLLQFAVVGE